MCPNKAVDWGYVLVAPGRLKSKEQMDAMAAFISDFGEFGPVWSDRVVRGSTRPRSQLVGRNDLLQAVVEGDTVHVAEPFCLGVSAGDAAWFMTEIAARGVKLRVAGEVVGDDAAREAMAAEVKRKQNVQHVRANRGTADMIEPEPRKPGPKVQRRWPKGHVVYRHFDAEGGLLYIGQTKKYGARVVGHRKKPWFAEVARVEFEHFDSEREALDAEKRAIWYENPKHNVRRNPPKSK